MVAFTFDEATHTYMLDGVRLPSVTEIIRPLTEGWLARIPLELLAIKRAFGVAVHKACELDDNGELDDAATDQRVMGCVNGWRAFRRDLDVEVLANEQRLYHSKLGFAGTIDRLARIPVRNPSSAGALWLLDIKTGVEPHESYGVQLSGYSLLMDSQESRGELGEHFNDLWRSIMPDRIRRGTVHLFDDATYKLHSFTNPNDEPAFRACLSLHHWKESCK